MSQIASTARRMIVSETNAGTAPAARFALKVSGSTLDINP